MDNRAKTKSDDAILKLCQEARQSAQAAIQIANEIRDVLERMRRKENFRDFPHVVK